MEIVLPVRHYVGTSHKIEQRNKNPDTAIDDTNNISIVNNLNGVGG